MLIDPPANPRVLKNFGESSLPVLFRGNHKAWVTAHLFTAVFTTVLSTLLRPTAQKKKMPFKTLWLIDNIPDRPALVEMLNEMGAVFMLFVACGSRSPFDFQALLLKKYIC